MLCPKCGAGCDNIGCNALGVLDDDWWHCRECDWDDTQL